MEHGRHEYIDCWARLHDPVYQGGHLEAVVDRAQRAGIRHFVCPAAVESHWPTLLEMTLELPSVIPAFGLLPEALAEADESWAEHLEALLLRLPAAVGPMGLPVSMRASSQSRAVDALQDQLALARRLGRPALVRCTGRDHRLSRLLLDQPLWPAGLMLLDYRGPTEAIDGLVTRGAYFCYAGDVLHQKAGRCRDLLGAVPRDRLLLASNAPGALPPRRYAPYQHFNITSVPFNEPANLPHVARGVAEVLGLTPADLADTLNHNALCLFGPLIQNET